MREIEAMSPQARNWRNMGGDPYCAAIYKSGSKVKVRVLGPGPFDVTREFPSWEAAKQWSRNGTAILEAWETDRRGQQNLVE